MNGSTLYQAKKRGHPTLKVYRAWWQLLDWFTRLQMTLILYGQPVRDGRTERVLKRSRESQEIRAKWYDGRWVYCVRRINRKNADAIPDHIYHGLKCSEGLIRFYLSDRNCTFIPAREFYNLGYRPEWGITYISGMTLLYEFCTEDNTKRELKNKKQTYLWGLPENQVVLFVLDINKEQLPKYVSGPFFFVDRETFEAVDYGQQLVTPIYIWGENGETYPLRSK